MYVFVYMYACLCLCVSLTLYLSMCGSIEKIDCESPRLTFTLEQISLSMSHTHTQLHYPFHLLTLCLYLSARLLQPLPHAPAISLCLYGCFTRVHAVFALCVVVEFEIGFSDCFEIKQMCHYVCESSTRYFCAAFTRNSPVF